MKKTFRRELLVAVKANAEVATPPPSSAVQKILELNKQQEQQQHKQLFKREKSLDPRLNKETTKLQEYLQTLKPETAQLFVKQELSKQQE